jgi:hypothetical protein
VACESSIVFASFFANFGGRTRAHLPRFSTSGGLQSCEEVDGFGLAEEGLEDDFEDDLEDDLEVVDDFSEVVEFKFVDDWVSADTDTLKPSLCRPARMELIGCTDSSGSTSIVMFGKGQAEALAVGVQSSPCSSSHEIGNRLSSSGHEPSEPLAGA